MSVAVTLIMTFAAAFISGLDTAGSKRWQRFFITSAMWSLALVITYGLLQLQIPYWVVFFIAAILFSIPAINGPFWARLGMSCLVIAAMTFSLYRSDAAGYHYPFLIFGPLIFSLCSWLWFAVWKNFALKVCVSAIYNDLANYIQLRENVLSGKQYDDVEIRNNKHALVGLLRQAFQSEAFMSKKHNEALIFTDLYLAQDLFEIILSSHTTNPALLEQFKTDPEKHAALVNWSQECQALLQTKSLQILSNAKREAVSSSLLEKAEQLAGLVKQEGSSRIEHWAYTIVHISQRIVDDKPVYDRSYQIQPFEFTWRWPTLTHPIWRYVFRVGVIFSVGTGIAEYYDEEGNSLRKAFLKAPLDFFRITSRFSNARFHPILKRYRAHHGVDYAAPTGTPVRSIGAGKVTHRAYQGGGGNYIKITHNGTYSTTYMHLSGFAKGLVPGKIVQQGEVIGYVGSTGLSTGPHLDFRVYKNGKAINPLSIEAPPMVPIKPAYKDSFQLAKQPLLHLFDSLQKQTQKNLIHFNDTTAQKL
jgi:murein DD-endopeptidase MepM/ murein hydrolase activator NlpD